jgi:arylsulfatase A-like enzyme
LKEAGYETSICGKWHLGHFQPAYLPTHRGFDHQYGHYNGALDYFTHERDGGFDWHEDGKPSHDQGYSTTLVGEHAAEFVTENAAAKKPFFMYVPFNAVHAPYQPPKGGTDAYPNLKGTRRDYAAMLTEVDNQVGRIVAAVDKAGIRDNTLFIFSSDNGGPAPGKVTDNGKYRGGKGGLYEGGVRVAAFATWDGHIKPGTTITEPMHVVDWRPTLEKLCGASEQGDKELDGLDIWPTLTAGAPSPHKFILLNATPRASALRAGDWKLIAKRGDAPAKNPARRARRNANAKGPKNDFELYDLKNDPYEKNNVAADNPDKVKELRDILMPLAKEAAPPKNKPADPAFKSPKIWGDAG